MRLTSQSVAVILMLSVAVLSMSCQPLFAQNLENQVIPSKDGQAPVYVYRCNPGICFWDSKSGESRDAFFSRSAFQLSVSSKGFVAFVVQNRLKDDYEGTSPTDLIVLEPDGKLLRQHRTEKLLRAISWSPDGSRLACLTGSDPEGRNWRQSFDEASVSIYDVEANTWEQAFAGGAKLYWAPFDGKIYIYGMDLSPVVQRYVPDTGKVELTDYPDINFNPAGTHYFVTVEDEVPTTFSVYESSTHTVAAEVTAPGEPGEVYILQRMAWFDSRWLMYVANAGIGSPLEAPNYIFNIQTGETRKSNTYILAPREKSLRFVFYINPRFCVCHRPSPR